MFLVVAYLMLSWDIFREEDPSIRSEIERYIRYVPDVDRSYFSRRLKSLEAMRRTGGWDPRKIYESQMALLEHVLYTLPLNDEEEARAFTLKQKIMSKIHGSG